MAVGICKFQPQVSVVLALADHRRQAARAIESWHRQTVAPLEVVVVAQQPADPTVGELPLGPADRLVHYPSQNVNQLTDIGARLARGQLLFVTESHVVANPDCLEEVLRYFEQHDVDAACVHSYGINENSLADAEERNCQQDFAMRTAPGHWNKVTIRGIAMRREVYLASGGFEYRYGHFSEPLLGIRLHEAGYRVGYIPRAIVGHYNNATLKMLETGIRDYGRGWARYAEEHPNGDHTGYFGRCKVWESVAARQRLQQNLRECGWRDLRRALRGPRWHLARAAVKRAWATFRLRLWRRSVERMLPAMRDYWQATIAYGQAEYFARPQPEQKTAPATATESTWRRAA